MKLEKQHRQALLHQLDESKKELSILQSCLNAEENQNIKEHFEIQMFLAQQKVKLIEQSLIDNEIDF